MSLADTKKEFLAVRTARGLANRKLFEERAPGVLRQTVYAALADEVEKERTLEKKIADLEALREKAREGGGPERAARQHREWKLTAHERIDLLLDPGSFF